MRSRPILAFGVDESGSQKLLSVRETRDYFEVSMKNTHTGEEQSLALTPEAFFEWFEDVHGTLRASYERMLRRSQMRVVRADAARGGASAQGADFASSGD